MKTKLLLALLALCAADLYGAQAIKGLTTSGNNTLGGNVTVPSGSTLTIASGATIVAEAGSTVTGLGGSGSGSGTVTAVSSGNITGFATVSVANGTSTPAFTFSLSSTSQNYVWAGPTSGSGAGGYRALVAGDIPTLTLSKISDAGGAAALNVGTSSGTVAAGNDSRITGAAPAASLVASNGSGPNAGNGLVHWTQLVGVPAGFADGSDDGSGGSSGTVTAVSSGNITGFATVSVANSTSTPAFTFSLSSTSQNYVWAGPTSGSGAGGYRALVAGDIPSLTLSKISDAGGAAALNVGTSSGTVAAGNDSRFTDTRTPTDASVTVAKVAAATVVTAAEGIGSNNNDTTFPTSAAVKAYADSVAGSGGLTSADIDTSAELAAILGDETGFSSGAKAVYNINPLILRPVAAMVGDAIDITKELNTKSYSGNFTWSQSATPADGQKYGVELTNSNSSPITGTLWGSVYSELKQATRSTIVIPGSWKGYILFERRGSTDVISGEPGTIADLVAIGTLATDDKIAAHDTSGGTDGYTTPAAILALGIDDTAYDATSWNGVTTKAPSQNAVRDKIESLTTAVVPDSSNKRYVTDAQLTVIGNTSGTNTGDQTTITGNAGSATVLQTARTINGVSFNGSANIVLPDVWVIPIGDETTAITTGTAKVTFRAPYAATVTAVRASLTTVSSSGTPTFDINEGGTTILSTKLTVDASEKTSTTAAAAAVISDTALADDAEITIDVDTAGTGAAGAKISIYVTR